MTDANFRVLDDQDLVRAVQRLERTVADLRHAQGEIGARVRLSYQGALDAARLELERRRT